MTRGRKRADGTLKPSYKRNRQFRHYAVKCYGSVRKLKGKLIQKTQGKCWLCNENLTVNDATVDHVVPTSLGGTHSIDNLILAHKECNRSRGNSICTPLGDCIDRYKG